jgi:hypothetical protein
LKQEEQEKIIKEKDRLNLDKEKKMNDYRKEEDKKFSKELDK